MKNLRALASVRRRLLTTLALGVVLALTAVMVPDAQVETPRAELIATTWAKGLDVGKFTSKGGTIWVLAVGSDARPGQKVTRMRGDALHLIGFNPSSGYATDISVPRDSYVTIPGHGRSKINEALLTGGLKSMGRAVGNLVGVQPHYVFVASFWETSDMINGIGGVDVDNPRAFTDSYVAPYGFKKGRIHINGPHSVDFARARHGLANGDFDRSANQSRIIRGIHRKIVARQHDVGFMAKGVSLVMKKMHTTGVSGRDLYQLAQAVAAINPGKIRTCVVPGGIGNAGAASVVFPNVGAARAMGNDARRDGRLNHGCRG